MHPNTVIVSMRNIILPLTCLLLLGGSACAQEDLLSQLDSTQVQDTYATAAFKGLQVITLQSTKMPAKKEFYFVVSHRFGTVKGGISEFFGFDDATTKIGGIYGLTDWLAVSGSRHTLSKVYETSVKYRLARQSDLFPLQYAGHQQPAKKGRLPQN